MLEIDVVSLVTIYLMIIEILEEGRQLLRNNCLEIYAYAYHL
jgi:hypothetical protein